MPFGKHVGKTFAVIMSKDPQYITWIYNKFDEGNKLKAAAGEALGYMNTGFKMQAEGGESYIRISLINGDEYPLGILGVDVSADYNELLLELHECCRKWDEERGLWLIPVPLLGDIIEHFPKVKLSKKLWLMCKWTKPIKLATV
jgi:hypothetical protein